MSYLTDPNQQPNQLPLQQLQKFETILKTWVERPDNNRNPLKEEHRSENKQKATSDIADKQMNIGSNMCKKFMETIEETYDKHNGSTHTINRTFTTALAVLGKYHYMMNNAKNCLQRTSGAPMVQRVRKNKKP